MRRTRLWSALFGMTTFAGISGDGFAAEPAPAAVQKPAPSWQIVIAPKYGPSAVAEFYPEADGSTTVNHRLITPGEHIGLPQAGPAPLPADGHLAPPPAPAESRAKLPATARNVRPNPFRLTAQETSDNDQPALPPLPPNSERGTAAPPAPAVAKPTRPPELIQPKPADAESKDDAVPEAAPQPAPAPAELAGTPAAAPPWAAYPAYRPSYAEVYASIPFIRTEYLANPSYRHEATMEILFGQLRPTVINKTAPTPIIRRNDYDYVTPYSYWNGRGYTNYNFYYPRPTVYNHY